MVVGVHDVHTLESLECLRPQVSLHVAFRLEASRLASICGNFDVEEVSCAMRMQTYAAHTLFDMNRTVKQNDPACCMKLVIAIFCRFSQGGTSEDIPVGRVYTMAR